MEFWWQNSIIVVLLFFIAFIGLIGGCVVSHDAYDGFKKRHYAKKEFFLRIFFSTLLFLMGFVGAIKIVCMATPIKPEQPYQGLVTAAIMSISAVIVMSFKKKR